MWVYPTWVGDPHFTHIKYPRPTCRRPLMSNVHGALPTEVNRVKTRMFLRPIRGPSRWPRGQRVTNGAFVGNSLALEPTGPLL